MIFLNPLFLWFISFFRLIVAVNIVSTGESGAQQFLKSLNGKSIEIASKLVSAQWDFETNNTENAKKELFQITSEAITNAKQRFNNVVSLYPWRSFSAPNVRRQLKLYSEIGTLALPTNEYQQFQKIMSDLNAVNDNSTICDYYNKTKCNLHLNADVMEKLETSQYSKELEYLWAEWREATEPQLKKLLEIYVQLCNKAAVLNNYTDFKEYSLRNIETKDIKEEMKSLWQGVRPLYEQIHAYVRRKLRDIYTEKNVPRTGYIPAHFLGNIWSENWSGIVHRIMPFPEEETLNFTSAMINQKYTPLLIRELAEDFFKSMNFSIPPNLWLNDTSYGSQVNKRTENCHPKILNFFNNNIRIKDCGKVSLKDYLTANRLVAQAEFMLQYSHQPFVFQSPADPGLGEAVNNMVTMSASTFKNLKKLGLYKDEINEKVRLNRLFKLALNKITTIPFLMVQEFWRWDVYSGKPIEDTIVTLKNFREKFQGISTFTKELSFDPGGVGSVFSKLSLTHSFMGYFLEFQMYDALCQMSGESQKTNETLDECSLYENAEAGLALRNIMKSGSSKSLKETLAPLLGQEKINSKSITKYFEPLMTWLKKKNEQTGEFIGWEDSKRFKEFKNKSFSKKVRRKRSLEEYSAEDKIADKNPPKESDRFQRINHKRSNDNKKVDMSDRERKSAENERKGNEKESAKNKNLIAKNEKDKRSLDKGPRRIIYSKNRRSLDKNNKNVIDNGEEEQRGSENTQKPNQFASRSNKRHSESYGPAYENSKTNKDSINKKEETSHKKRSDDQVSNKNYANTGLENNVNRNVVGPGNKIKVRFARRARKKQRRFDSEETSQNHVAVPRKDKRDSNTGLVSNVGSDENPFEGVLDYGRIKAGDAKNAGESFEDKARPTWSVKSYKTDSSSLLQPNSELNNEDSPSSFQLANSLMIAEKSVGKKEISLNNVPNESSLLSGKSKVSETENHALLNEPLRQLGIDIPALQLFLKNSDLGTLLHRPVFGSSPEQTEAKANLDFNHELGSKLGSGKLSAMSIKNTPNDEIFQLKDRKEYKDDLGETKDKSSYIIILGQVSPEVKDRLLQEKLPQLLDLKQESAVDERNWDDKSTSDKKHRALNDQIYIVPIEFKNLNSVKTNHYSEHWPETGHGPNTERDQESEERQLDVGENSNADDKSNYFNEEKENPSELVLSWNNEKNRKIVKRSKREHMKEGTDDKAEVVRIVPMKASLLEGLLGKSFDRANLDENNVKILIHDALLNGNTDLPASLDNSSPIDSFASDNAAVADQDQNAAFHSPNTFQAASLKPAAVFQPASFQPSSSLSSLASSVISALSPKTLSQVAKNSNQRLNSDAEEENAKESFSGSSKDQKVSELPFIVTPGLRCNALLGKKKSAKLFSDEDIKKVIDFDSAAKGDDACCKKIILSSCPTKCQANNSPYPNSGYPSTYPTRDPCPIPTREPYSSTRDPCPTRDSCREPGNGNGNGNGNNHDSCQPHESQGTCNDQDNNKKDNCKSETDTCKKPSECSLVNCQFKITKAKKPHERLTIMIYDRINPPAELPEPYDALAVISEILQRIQNCAGKPACQLTEEDPDYPSNDNSDQLKGNPNPSQENKQKAQELNGELPILSNDSPEEDEGDNPPQNGQNAPNPMEEDKYQPKDKATPAIDQLTVFNKDKLKPVFIELRKVIEPYQPLGLLVALRHPHAPDTNSPKYLPFVLQIDDIIKKRSQKEQL